MAEAPIIFNLIGVVRIDGDAATKTDVLDIFLVHGGHVIPLFLIHVLSHELIERWPIRMHLFPTIPKIVDVVYNPFTKHRGKQAFSLLFKRKL